MTSIKHLVRCPIAFVGTLLVSAPVAGAQTVPVRAGDTVRVWYPASPIWQQATLTAVAGDTIVLAGSPVPVRRLERVDVARGGVVDRRTTTRFVAAGLVIGIGAGALLKDRTCRSATCDSVLTVMDYARSGGMLGAGAGFLISRMFKVPRWFTVWPSQEPASPSAAVPRDTTRRVGASNLLGMTRGDPVRIWRADSAVLRGKFDRLSDDSASLLLYRDPRPIRLASIDALDVGRRHTGRDAALGALALGAPIGLLAAVLCGLDSDGCDPGRVAVVTGAFAFVGFGAGAAVGSRDITWELRFSR